MITSRKSLLLRTIGESVSKIRPIKFSVKNTDNVYQILRKAKRLKDIDGYKTVYISPNRTNEERLSRRTLVNELKKKRLEDQSSHYFIRKGEIVKAEEFYDANG